MIDPAFELTNATLLIQNLGEYTLEELESLIKKELSSRGPSRLYLLQRIHQRYSRRRAATEYESICKGIEKWRI